jgi:hypothetical protein
MTVEDKTMIGGLLVLVGGIFLLNRYNKKSTISKEEETVIYQSCLNVAKEKGITDENLDAFVSDCTKSLLEAEKEAIA